MASNKIELNPTYDCGKGNLLSFLIDKKPITYLLGLKQYFIIWIISAFLFYIFPLLYCLLTQPTVFSADKSLQLPFNLDFGGFTLELIMMPMLIANIFIERRLINKTYHQLFDGPIHIDNQNEFSQEVNSKYLKYNIYSSVVCFVFSIIITFLWLHSFLLKPEIKWHTYGSLPDHQHLNFIGIYAAIFLVFFSWFMLSTTAVRYLWHFKIFSLIVKRYDLEVVPFHPDKCGGLSMVSGLVRANQPIVLSVGLIVAGNYANNLIILHYPVLALTNISMFVGFILICIAAFILPLIPYRAAMQKKKYETLAKINILFSDLWKSELQKIDIRNATGVKTSEMENLMKLHEFANQLPVWPFNIKTVKSFFSFLSVPFLAALLSTLWEKIFSHLLK